MKKTLDVALIQSDLIWERPRENRKIFQRKIESIEKKVDVIVLPEMFTTGFTMNAAAVGETMKDDTVKWMQDIAGEKSAAITGSVVIHEGEHYYNRSLFVHPSGKVDHYDKKHTFTLAGENITYASGNVQQIVTYEGWKICLLICYDLRFPVWARNTKNYDVLIYVASWPEPRIAAWDTLLKARAIENMCYTIGVNRTGIDGEGHVYPGHSVVYDALGSRMVFSDEEEILHTKLHKEHIEENRRKFRFLDDRDTFVFT